MEKNILLRNFDKNRRQLSILGRHYGSQPNIQVREFRPKSSQISNKGRDKYIQTIEPKIMKRDCGLRNHSYSPFKTHPKMLKFQAKHIEAPLNLVDCNEFFFITKPLSETSKSFEIIRSRFEKTNKKPWFNNNESDNKFILGSSYSRNILSLRNSLSGTKTSFINNSNPQTPNILEKGKDTITNNINNNNNNTPERKMGSTFSADKASRSSLQRNVLNSYSTKRNVRPQLPSPVLDHSIDPTETLPISVRRSYTSMTSVKPKKKHMIKIFLPMHKLTIGYHGIHKKPRLFDASTSFKKQENLIKSISKMNIKSSFDLDDQN